MSEEIISVKLTKRYQQLNAGETGGYDRETAERLVKEGAGVIVPTPEVPRSIEGTPEQAAELVAAQLERVEAQNGFDAAVRRLESANVREANALAAVAFQVAPKMILVRLHRRFGSLNGEARHPQTNEVVRPGEVGCFDEATAEMLCKEGRGPDGSPVQPWGVRLTDAEAREASAPTPKPEPPQPALVQIKLLRRVGSLNAGEVGCYDEAMARKILANDARLGPAGVIVEPAVLEAAPAEAPLTDPAVEAIGPAADNAGFQDANSRAWAEREKAKRERGRR